MVKLELATKMWDLSNWREAYWGSLCHFTQVLFIGCDVFDHGSLFQQPDVYHVGLGITDPMPPVNWPWLLRKSNMAMRNPLGKTSRNYKWMIFYCNVSLPASTANHWFLQWPRCLFFRWMRPYVSDIFLPRPSCCNVHLQDWKIWHAFLPCQSMLDIDTNVSRWLYNQHWLINKQVPP